jgi:ABC-2 type transport system ATP-binding protein
MLDFSKKGRVSNFIVRGEREVILPKIEAMQPLLMDLLPLSLEEVFVYEMEALGYAFKDVMM